MAAQHERHQLALGTQRCRENSPCNPHGPLAAVPSLSSPDSPDLPPPFHARSTQRPTSSTPPSSPRQASRRASSSPRRQRRAPSRRTWPRGALLHPRAGPPARGGPSSPLRRVHVPQREPPHRPVRLRLSLRLPLRRTFSIGVLAGKERHLPRDAPGPEVLDREGGDDGLGVPERGRVGRLGGDHEADRVRGWRGRVGVGFLRVGGGGRVRRSAWERGERRGWRRGGEGE